jgi:L,D-transpeptidase YcbB
MRTTSRIALLSLATLVGGAAEPSDAPRPEASAVVQGILRGGRHPWLARPGLAGELAALKALYAAEPNGLFWFDGAAPRPALQGSLSTLGRAAEHGLDPADYDAAPLLQRWEALRASPAPSLSDRALLDVGLSVSAMRLLSDVHLGRVDPKSVGFDFDVSAKRLDLAAPLRSARDGGGLEAGLAAAEPPFIEYRQLMKALAEARARMAAGEPAPVPALPEKRKKVEPGKPWAGATALAKRLRALGDLSLSAAPPPTGKGGTPVYRGAVVDAVRRFQGRHALEPDGVVGPGTLEAVNIPVARRARQIELALERMRWLPLLPNEPLVLVNVPLFRLWVLDPARPSCPLSMNVVVGKAAGHATPLFVDRMEYVIFRPYWNPPPSIIRSEILPHARRDPAYLGKQDMEIVASGDENARALPATRRNLAKVEAGRLHLRQKPGEKNSLGLAKFILPNAENVYLHGTPAKQLFSRPRRDFSHGCIRVEDPALLAEWVLRSFPEWTRERIGAAMAGKRPTRVKLKKPLAVVIFYDTVLVDADGVVYFASDYYGHDARLEQALRAAGLAPRPN